MLLGSDTYQPKLRLNIHGYIVAPYTPLCLDKEKRGREIHNYHPDPTSKFHLSILGVNHQIHNEASLIFFSSVTLHFGISDIAHFQPESEYEAEKMYPLVDSHERDNHFCTAIENRVWRYNPLYYDPSPAVPLRPGENPYDHENKWDEDEGEMEPHIFTQFQNLSICITLEDLI